MQLGLTLLEILLAGVILVIVLGIITQGIMGGSSVVTTVVTESDLIEDTRVAGQMIADRVSSAVYIYPPGVELSLSTKGRTSQNPRTDTGDWTVGVDPILAYIEAPEHGIEHIAQCAKIDGDAVSTDNAFCYYFVAFYPVKRSSYLAGGKYAEVLADRLNDKSAWVLMEYRSVIARNTPLVAKDSTRLEALSYANAPIKGKSGTMLADFIVPFSGFMPVPATEKCHRDQSSSWTQENCEIIKAKFATNPTVNDSLASIEFQVQTRYTSARGTRETPPMTFTAALRNPAYLNEP